MSGGAVVASTDGEEEQSGQRGKVAFKKEDMEHEGSPRFPLRPDNARPDYRHGPRADSDAEA